MPGITFEELARQLQNHFDQGSYAEGLDQVAQLMDDYPDHQAALKYFQMGLAARLGRTELVNQVLENALKTGIWYSGEFLQHSPWLENMHGEPEFERLVEISVQMAQLDPKSHLPLIAIHAQGQCGAEDDPCPLLLFLHGNDDTAQRNVPHWRSAAEQGWVVVFPQSKQSFWTEGYAWYDHESAAEQIQEHLTKLVRGYNLDPERIVLAGFSMGADVALWLALSGRMKARGFILLGPGGPLVDNPREWDALLGIPANPNLRGAIIMGEADRSIVQENVETLAQRLNDHGIACNLETHPDLAHEYPVDFADSLQKSLDFIFEV
ncbi:MAG: dienelactone hydrolase family protein [Anaerolineales bacterium]|nr:dienelactone hydrolase family protein [Anaerolineales bacterium]